MCTLQWRLKKIKDVDWLIATREIECHFGPGGFKASQEVVEGGRTMGPELQKDGVDQITADGEKVGVS